MLGWESASYRLNRTRHKNRWEEFTEWPWRPWAAEHNVGRWLPAEAWHPCTWRWLLWCCRWRRSSRTGWIETQSNPGDQRCTSSPASRWQTARWKRGLWSLQNRTL